MGPLEFLFGPLLLGDALECHPYLVLPVLLEVEERVWVLQLVEVPLDVLIVVDVLHQLSPPFAALLVVHELFAV